MSHQSFRRISPFLGGLIQRSQTEKMGNPFRGQTILGRFSATSMALRIATLLPPAAGYPAVSPTKANRKKSMTIYLWNHGNRCISGLNWLNPLHDVESQVLKQLQVVGNWCCSWKSCVGPLRQGRHEILVVICGYAIFLGIWDTQHQPYQKRLWDSWKASCKITFHQLNEPKTSRPIFLLRSPTNTHNIHT